MKWTQIILVFLCFGMATPAIAQETYQLDKKAQKCYDKAMKEANKKNYDKAIKKIDDVLEDHPDFMEGRLKKATMLYLQKKHAAAAASFSKAIDIDPAYDPEMYFSRAKVYEAMEAYERSAVDYRTYASKSSNTEKVAKATSLAEQMSFKARALANPVPFVPKKLPATINSSDSEYIAAFTVDEERFVFTRRERGEENLYISYVDEGGFSEAIPIADLNTPGNEGVHTLSANGNMLIFTACDRRQTGLGSCDLYISRLDQDDWLIPDNFGAGINTVSWEGSPSLSSDGRLLFFSSDRKGSKGGKDIYLSVFRKESGWSLPVSLPKEINTELNEESPFFHPDGRTLYFRSNGHPGMGSYDIYYSRYNEETGKWSTAKNLGYPINTEGSEGAMSVSLDGQTAFFASDMNYETGERMNHLDLYTFDLYEEAQPFRTTFVKATVKDAKTGQLLDATYTIKTESDNEDFATGTVQDGVLLRALPLGEDYSLIIEKKGYVMRSLNFKLEEIKNAIDPYLLEVELDPIPTITSTPEPTKAVVLNNIFFETGSATLLPSSDFEIQKLADFLTENPSLKIEVLGHTDNVGNTADNQLLSKKRALSVKQALKAKGITSARISTKGFGETQPLASNDTEAGRQTNRRTEFRIINQ